MKKVVIAGSASLQEQCQKWKSYWEEGGCEVLDYPVPIAAESFLDDYPRVHKDFFHNILRTDVLFVMNEDKDGVTGYIGAETFAEMCFGVTQNLINDKKIKIILLKMPEKSVQSYDEVCLWLKLGWIQLHQK